MIVGILFYLAFGLGLPVALAAVMAAPQSRAFLRWSTVLGSGLLLVALILAHHIMPFQTPRGDDYFYLRVVDLAGGDLAGTIARLTGRFEQPGFPVLVALLGPLADNSLLALKTFNLGVFLINALVWYRIGRDGLNESTGRLFLLAMLAATPLWVYFFFLLKDQLIVLCQSLVIWGAILQARPRKGLWLITLGLVGLLFLRVPLVAMNLPLIGASVLVLRGARIDLDFRGLLTLAGLAALSIGAIVVITDPQILADLGLASSRALSVTNVQSTLRAIAVERAAGPIVRLLVYFFIEMSWFSSFGRAVDTELFRSYTAIPWIFLGLPFFVMSTPYAPFIPRRPDVDRHRLVLVLWGVTLAYLVLSFLAVDTTRWRMPGFPAMIALAVIGWQNAAGRRLLVWAGFTAVIVFGIVVYYGVRG